MNGWNLVPLAAGEFSRICGKLNLSDAALRLLGDVHKPGEFLQQLHSHELLADAVRVLPHLLPKRVAVWWGCLSVWSSERVQVSLAARQAIQAAVAWVQQPGMETRLAAVQAGEIATPQLAAGCLALAAGWSAGSLAPPNVPVVPPPHDLTARLVASSVLLAGVQGRPLEFQANYQRMLQLGTEVARGENLWLTAVPPAAVSISVPAKPRLRAQRHAPPWFDKLTRRAQSVGR